MLQEEMELITVHTSIRLSGNGVKLRNIKVNSQTTEFGNFLIELATKYNDALLVVENNNIGWATLQTIIDRGYENLFYQEKNH